MFISFLSIFIILSSSQVYSDHTNGDINSWCNQTPYPKECKYHINNINDISNLISPISRKQFLTMAEQAALEEVDSALHFTKSLGLKVLNDAERSAWRSCLFFYSQTVYRLNKTLDATASAHDIQTWLSAAATNIRTCNEAFFHVNMTNNIHPLVVSSNVTQLISNSLAVNFVLFNEAQAKKLQAYSKNISIKANNPDCVVAQDGSGDYKTITEALNASAKRRNTQFVIYVKQGTYNEIVNVQQSDIVMYGDGIDKTIITGNRITKDCSTMFECASFIVSGDGFKGMDITFQNTAGATAGQALAMASSSDHSVFYKCAFKGYQDTLLLLSNRQFYKNCDVYGTVDFICGNPAAVFQDCTLYLRNNPNGGLVVTAESRGSQEEATGITIHRGSVQAAPDDKPSPQLKAFLGRPWRAYSQTMYLRVRLDDLVDPAGWMPWAGAPGSTYSTLDYGEFYNNGAGASLDGRVKWPGYHILKHRKDAEPFDVTNLIDGQSWLPQTGIPFDGGVN